MSTSDDKLCQCCQQPLEDGSGDQVQAMVCGHVYHQVCLDAYCRVKGVSLPDLCCPVCNVAHNSEVSIRDVMLQDPEHILGAVVSPVQIGDSDLGVEQVGDDVEQVSEATPASGEVSGVAQAEAAAPKPAPKRESNPSVDESMAARQQLNRRCFQLQLAQLLGGQSGPLSGR